VTVNFSNSAGSTVTDVTDSSGYYSLSVSQGWSGTVTPNMGGYMFVPENLSYSSISSDQMNQNFTGKPEDLLSPANLEARSGIDSIRLTWEPVISSYLTGYNVYRSASESGSYTRINTEPLTEDYYVDASSDLTKGNAYYYYLITTDTFDNESEPSDPVSVVFGRVRIFIPDSVGESGSEVRLPINISNADGLSMCGLDIYITYSPDVLSATTIEKTSLSSVYAWTSDLETPGVARAMISSSVKEPLYGGGALFYVLFNVNGNSGESTTLEFQASGTSVYNCVGDHDLEAIDIDLSDSGIFTVGEKHSLGDVNGDEKIDSADLFYTLNAAVGNIELTQEMRNAGDVSGDGYIRSNDVALILRIWKGLPLAPESSDTGRERSVRSSPVTVSVPDNILISAGSSVWVPVSIDDAAKVMGTDIVLNYDPSLITATDARISSVAGNANIVAPNTDQPGQVRIAFSSMESDGLPQGSQTLVEVEFTAKPEESGNSQLILTGMHLNDTYGRDFATSALQTDVNTNSGSLRVVGLRDAISVLKVLTGSSDTDMNGDWKIATY